MMENLDRLVNELCKLPNETQWLEFKHNNYTPDMIGSDISALANSAALHEKSCSYMLWGIDDTTHEIIGTDYDLQTLKKGNQELENWLRSLLSRNADFEFQSVQMNNGKRVGVLIIYKATNQTVMFNKIDYIRVGSYTKRLSEYPALQAQLWDKIRNSRFEERYAKQDLDLEDALRILDYSAYFDISGTIQPSDFSGAAHYLQQEEISGKGYAVGFEGLMKFIEALIPTQEPIVGALRERKSAYPIIAIREAVANALIHQDFSISGTGPVVEIFEKRIEITNSGTPLVDIRRIIDNPPKSRNEKLASLMRRLRMCEELGSGWDKIVSSCEFSQLPAPKIELYDESTRVVLFSEIPFSALSIEEKLWACYLHACIKQVEGEQLTNSSLRERFGLKDTSSGSVSRLIKEAVSEGLIKPLDSTTAPRYMRYIPSWA